MTAAATAPLLELRSIHLWRGDLHLLQGLSLAVSAGELWQVLGPNGAGKTSLLRVACGLLPAESGDVLWQGRLQRIAREEFNRQCLYLAHHNALKLELTADENLRFALGLERSTSVAARRAAMERVGIARCAQLPARALSAGQRRRLAFARALLKDARLWILDEPTTNLDAAGVQLVEELLGEHLGRGGAVLAAAHHPLLAGHDGVRQLLLGARAIV